MPLYEFKCEKCNNTQDLFYNMNDKRPDYVDCDQCGGRAVRIFSIGASFLKKKRVGDIWDEAGVDPIKCSKERRRAANSERIQRMREQAKVNIERSKKLHNGN